MDKHKKRNSKYKSSLKSNPTITENEYYIGLKNNKMKQVDPDDVRKNGLTYKTVQTILTDTKEQLSSNKVYLKTCEDTITATLNEYGYNSPNVELKLLIEDILKLKLIHPKKEYISINVDEGYVKSVDECDFIVESTIFIPEDYGKGYWKFENGAFVLDEEKYNWYWSMV